MTGLPQGWSEATLDEVASVNPGRMAGISPDTTVSFIPMPAVSDIEGEIIDPLVRPFAEVSKGYTHFREGDVIFAKITPCMENGKIAVARSLENGIACGSTEFHVVRLSAGVLPDYVWRYLRQKSFRTEAEAVMTGAVGQRRVPVSHLKESRLPLPPLGEQRRIVAKIDSLSGKSRRARDHLDHVPRLVEKYKQAVLAAAFNEARRTARSSTSVLGDIATEVRNGLAKKPTGGPEGIPILRISAVRPLRVHLSDVRYYPTAEVPVAALLRVGDLLFTRYNGNPDLTAVCGQVHELRHALTYPDKLIRVRVTADTLPSFVELMCTSPQARDWLKPHIKSAAGQHGISGGDLKNLPIPLPPTEQQEAVVRRVGTAFAWIDRLASEATSARRLIELLDQTVLAQAFRGELVSQDPADEPASALLERIRGTARPALSRRQRHAR